ncbi:MAG: Phosphomannomutase, partial [Actinomyces urogenitalis DORA_12]
MTESPAAASLSLVDTDAVAAWISEDPDETTREELTSLLARHEDGDTTATAVLADAFSSTLQFGTAGLRGRLGGGPNRMNRVVVIRAAAGLSAYLREQLGDGFTVVI